MYLWLYDLYQNCKEMVVLPASGRAGLGLNGMVSVGKCSINVVIANKPKMLIGLCQKAMWWVQGFPTTLSWAKHTTGG